jgi:phage-related protein
VAGQVWQFYQAPGGGSPVQKDIRAEFKSDKRGLTRLAQLMGRIASCETLRRDVVDLGGGLLEARLSHMGNEYRLFFARVRSGEILLALHFVNKKARTVPREIALARWRLAGSVDGV